MSDDGRPTVADRDVSYRVIQRVASAKDVDPLELEPLYEVIDPDALDELFDDSTESPDEWIRFTMAECRVTVYGSGEIDVVSGNDVAGSATANGSVTVSEPNRECSTSDTD